MFVALHLNFLACMQQSFHCLLGQPRFCLQLDHSVLPIMPGCRICELGRQGKALSRNLLNRVESMCWWFGPNALGYRPESTLNMLRLRQRKCCSAHQTPYPAVCVHVLCPGALCMPDAHMVASLSLSSSQQAWLCMHDIKCAASEHALCWAYKRRWPRAG